MANPTITRQMVNAFGMMLQSAMDAGYKPLNDDHNPDMMLREFADAYAAALAERTVELDSGPRLTPLQCPACQQHVSHPDHNYCDRCGEPLKPGLSRSLLG